MKSLNEQTRLCYACSCNFVIIIIIYHSVSLKEEILISYSSFFSSYFSIPVNVTLHIITI